MKQILLKGVGCSGRGVRIELLDHDTSTNTLENAAKEIGPDGTMTELRLKQSQNAVAAMVRGVTEKDGFKTKDDLVAATWKKVELKDLDGNLSKYFTTKDIDALIKVYNRFHAVSEEELKDILGEALDVTVD